jgi:drug/metabolite transporter superfamily protein YnfA
MRYPGLSLLFLCLSIGQLVTIVHDYTIYQVYYVLQYHTMCLVTVYLISPVLLIQQSISKRVFYTTFALLFGYFVVLSLIWGASVHEFDYRKFGLAFASSALCLMCFYFTNRQDHSAENPPNHVFCNSVSTPICTWCRHIGQVRSRTSVCMCTTCAESLAFYLPVDL